MHAPKWSRIEAILDHALTLSGPKRTAYIDKACAHDPTLKDEVYRLLEDMAKAEASSFLKQPAGYELQNLARQAFASDADEWIGQTLGGYRVLEHIGSGGMGSVYLAKRVDESFHQQVAIKLIKRGMNTDRVIRRFVRERQILAQLRHPHIARLIDGGVTEDGLPYFVMDHIEGLPLISYCDTYTLTVGERIDLFQQICEAVRYAHQNLIVHRDLKPSNILVTPAGQVKLLDFGIAKMLDYGQPDQTRTDTQILTPAYAAPEQIKREPITTATDVYALGILLYELLTGHRPYRVANKTYEDLIHAICNTIPIRPSMAISQVSENKDGSRISPDSLSAKRRTTPAQLKRRLRGDLDTITLMALRKEPSRRYPSADAMLVDLNSHVAGMPITAQKDTFGYRAGKFVRRHKWGVTVTLVGVLAGLGFTWQLVQERNRAETKAAEAEAVSNYLVSLFAAPDPFSYRSGDYEDVDADTLRVADFLRLSAKRVELDLNDQPAVKALLLSTMGTAFQNLSDLETAEHLISTSIGLRSELGKTEQENVVKSLATLADINLDQGQYQTADSLYKHALELSQTLDDTPNVQTAVIYNGMGIVELRKGNYVETEALFREALSIRLERLPPEHNDIFQSYNNLGAVQMRQGKYDEAEQNYNRCLEFDKVHLGLDHPGTAITLGNLATVAYQKGDYDKSERLNREALAIRRQRLAPENSYISQNLNNLATTLRAKGNYDEALALFKEARSLFHLIQGSESSGVAISLLNIGTTLGLQDKNEEALEMLYDALEMWKRLFGPAHPRIAQTMMQIGIVLMEEGQLDEAEAFHRQALAMRQELIGTDHPDIAASKSNLGVVLTAQGALEEAEPYHLQAVDLAIKSLGQTHPYTQTYVRNTVALYETWNRPEQAATYRERLTE